MLDFIGTIVTAALMTLVVNALVIHLAIERGAKLALASIAGVWIGLAAAGSASGWMAIARPVPVIGIFVATPLVATAIATASPAARAALLGLPTRLLIGLNIARVLAVLFFLLWMEGRLAGPFPFSAGWGDIITGVFAVPFLFAAIDAKHEGAIAAWNLFGTADLVLAIFFGVTSAEGAAAALPFAAGFGRDAISAMVIRPDRAGAVVSDHARHRLGPTARAEDRLKPRNRYRAPRDLTANGGVQDGAGLGPMSRL